MALQFMINSLSGPMCSVPLDRTCRPLDLYEAVETATGIPATQQTFFRGLQQIHQHDTLDRFILDNDDDTTIHLSLVRQEDPFCKIVGFVMESDDRYDSEITTIEKAKFKCLSVDYQGFFISPELEDKSQVGVHYRSPDGFRLVPGDGISYVRMSSSEDFQHVLAVITGGTICNAPKSVLSDANFMRQAVRKHGHSLGYASDDLRNDPDIVLDAVVSDGGALLYASTDLRANKDIVLEAVKQNGLSLAHASESLRSDRIIVLHAVQQNPHALKYASRNLREDLDIVTEAVKINGRAFQYVPDERKSDHDICRAALRHSTTTTQHVEWGAPLTVIDAERYIPKSTLRAIKASFSKIRSGL